MPIVGTRAGGSVRAYGWSSFQGPETLGGMVLMTPSSIASTGTGNSSSIGANGSVTFSTCATLSLNGVFTSTYDNYMVSIRHLGSTTSQGLQFRLRVSGSDASGTNYVFQQLVADSTSVSAARTLNSTYGRIGNVQSTQRSGDVVYIYGPALTQPTAFRNVSASGYLDASVIDHATTHSLSTSYDGVTLIAESGTFSGLVSVYGLVGA